MRIHNIYADANGETYFRDIEIKMTEHGPDGSTSGPITRHSAIISGNT
jgi:hypothetical protein